MTPLAVKLGAIRLKGFEAPEYKGLLLSEELSSYRALLKAVGKRTQAAAPATGFIVQMKNFIATGTSLRSAEGVGLPEPEAFAETPNELAPGMASASQPGTPPSTTPLAAIQPAATPPAATPTPAVSPPAATPQLAVVVPVVEGLASPFAERAAEAKDMAATVNSIREAAIERPLNTAPLEDSASDYSASPWEGPKDSDGVEEETKPKDMEGVEEETKPKVSEGATAMEVDDTKEGYHHLQPPPPPPPLPPPPPPPLRPPPPPPQHIRFSLVFLRSVLSPCLY